MIVTIEEYNPKWVKDFKNESEQLINLLGDTIHQVYHIGSTAVPNLRAKPIIDIMLDVKDLTQLDSQNHKLESLGYEVMGEFGIPGRRYFRKGAINRTHQIHAFQSGDTNLIRHLAFRDYLINHKNIAAEYGKLKSLIAERCNHDIEQYCNEKDPFIKHHEAIALKYYKGY